MPPGARVLDVGAGTGNVAAAASAAGAGEVVAAEPEPALVAAGRARLPGVEWVEAPASRLPFPDAAFDRVLSAFAAIFDPDHEATAAELARVCAPGGAIALTAWIPEGPLAAVAGLLRRGAPPPPGGARSPMGWADEAYARERLEPLGLAVEVSRETLAFEAASVEARVAAEERDTPAWVAARERLGADWPALRAELTAVLAAGNEATDGSFRVTSAYALIVARRPA